MKATTELNEAVQAVMADPTTTHRQAAEIAAAMITGFVTAEAGLKEGTKLLVPLSWQHRVPAEAVRHVVPNVVPLVLNPPVPDKSFWGRKRKS